MKTELTEVRQNINNIDKQIIALLKERIDYVKIIGKVKHQQGLSIYAPEREAEVYQRLIQAAAPEIPADVIKAIYREIMSYALHLEANLSIAYLGPVGSWSHQAAMKKFGSSVDNYPQHQFYDIFQKVASQQIDYGIIPVENSLEGSVTYVLDLFAEFNLFICSEIALPIVHTLLGNCSTEEISTVYSHPQSLAQCKQWLAQNLASVDIIETSSTAKAAEQVRDILSKDKNAKVAAISSALAAELYQLNTIATSIQDSKINTTRFLVVGNEQAPKVSNSDNRTSLILHINHHTGALLEVLRIFNKHNVNVLSICSRPLKKEHWKYLFYMDIAGHKEDEDVQQACNELQENTIYVKFLGSYAVT